MLNPIFTVPYIRHLTPVFYAVAYQLRDTMRIQIGLPSRVINIREPLTQVAVELIGQAGLGYNFGSLQGESHVYIKASKDILYAYLQSIHPGEPHSLHLALLLLALVS